MKPLQSMIDIYKDAVSRQPVSVNVFRRFRICPMHNGAPKSCQNADCCQLHLCLWFLADPDGKVHDKADCRLCHDLSGRNHRIRSALGIADGLKQREVLNLLLASHPKVCSAYNSESGCQQTDCADIHLCNNVKFKQCGKCRCRRQHVLSMDEQTKMKLNPFDMDKMEPGHVLRSFLIPAPLPNTNPNEKPEPPAVASQQELSKPKDLAPSEQAKGKKAKPEVPSLLNINAAQGVGLKPQLQEQQHQKKKKQKTPSVASDLSSEPDTAGLKKQQQRQQKADLQSKRQSKLSAGSVPNIAKLKLGSSPKAQQKPPVASAAANPKAPRAAPSEETLCEEFLRHECFSQNCPRRHCPHKVPYLWQWRAAHWPPGRWQDVDAALNEQLEAAFCQPDRSDLVTVGSGELGSEFPGQLTLSFVAGSADRFEIRSVSGHLKPPGGLRCLRTESRASLHRPLATNWRWFFLGSHGAWSSVEILPEPGLNEKLEEAFCRGDSSLTVGQCGCKLDSMLISMPGAPQEMPLRRRPAPRMQPVTHPLMSVQQPGLFYPGQNPVMGIGQPSMYPTMPTYGYSMGQMSGQQGPVHR
uniref:WWE domain-containing protein n=2 Tax=Macrostomum lignano TaxID=282301 RepID=A0A1I8GJV3_9PLAT